MTNKTDNANKFDPNLHLTSVQGRPYLEVKWRLAWLRSEHPEAIIETEPYLITEKEAVFKATVQIPNGGKATGWGRETPGDFPDFTEKAETKALGRALAAFGYGTQFCDDHNFGADNGRVVDAPVGNAPINVSDRRPSGPAAQTPMTDKQYHYLRRVATENFGMNDADLDLEANVLFGCSLEKLTMSQANQFIQKLTGKVPGYEPSVKRGVAPTATKGRKAVDPKEAASREWQKVFQEAAELGIEHNLFVNMATDDLTAINGKIGHVRALIEEYHASRFDQGG